MNIGRRSLLTGALGLPVLGAQVKSGALPALVAQWKLNGDCRDAAGNHHGVDRGVTFVEGRNGQPKGAAAFDGINASIEVVHDHDLRFETGEFSISLWLNVKPDLTSVIGDVMSKYHARQRKGFNLSVAGSSPGYSSVGDARNVRFGIDNGVTGSWLDCGRPWKSNPLISTLVVYKGNLYTGIADASRPEDACHVFRYAGGTDWEDCGRLGNDPLTLSVHSVIVHKGNLYGGTGVWDWIRSIAGAAGPSHVYCYEGGKTWRDCGQLGNGHRVLSLASFKGDLYAGDDTGKCYRYDGGIKWSYCGQLGNDNRLNTMMVYRGYLYGASHGNMYRYEGDTRWTCIGKRPFGTTQIHTLQVYDSHLYAGTWPFGKALRYEEGETWTDCGQLGISTDKFQINEINDLQVYNGKLYAGVIPKAEVYRYERANEWVLLRSLVTDPEWAAANGYSWTRVPCMTAFQGSLFMGSSTCYARHEPENPPEAGRVYAMEAGKTVSFDDDLGSGWKHVVAVKDRGRLKLYIDGQQRATSAPFDNSDYDITTREPLRIGIGAQNHFSGSMADIRIYAGALTDAQVSQIFKTPT